MAHTVCLVGSVSSVRDRSKNIGSQSGHINPATLAHIGPHWPTLALIGPHWSTLAHLPCFGRLIIDPACQPCFVNVPTTRALVELQNNMP